MLQNVYSIVICTSRLVQCCLIPLWDSFDLNMVQVPVASMLICETFWQNQGGIRHRPKLIFDIMKAYKTPFSTMLLFHVSRIFGSHDMVIYTSHLCRCLKNELMRNKSSKKVKLIDSHSDYLFLKLLKNISIPFFITISKNMNSKHIKVDRNQQIKKVSPHSVFLCFLL